MAKIGHPIKFVIRLTPEEHTRLDGMIHCGKGSVNSALKARILLKADVSQSGPGWSDERIAEALETSLSTVLRTRRPLVDEGLDAALSRKKSSWSPPRTFDGEAEAKLIVLACTKPPKGYTHWTLRLLEKRVVELGIVEAASAPQSIRCSKKTKLNRIKKYWVISPEADADFVAAMEDTLEIYIREHDPARPVICLNETSKQLTRETRTPLPHGPGREARIDYEYERAGVANLFMLYAPLECWRHVCVRKRRTANDYVHDVRDLVDVHFPLAEKIILVNENLNTHKLGSLYKTFPLAEARRIAKRIEMHFTPKHGSWLNMAECELSVLSRQCLARRIPDRTELADETEAWETTRNSVGSGCKWQFTTQDARTKLSHLYPLVECSSYQRAHEIILF